MSKDERNFEWAYRLLLAFAKHLYDDTHPREGEGQHHEWGERSASLQSVYLQAARELAGIDHDEFLKDIRNGTYDVSDLYYEGDDNE